MKGSSGYVIKEQPYWDVVPPALFRDRSIWSNHGTHTNITWFQLPNGLYVREGATNGGITVPHDPSITFTYQNFSGLIWVYPLTHPAANNRFMQKGSFQVDGFVWYYNGTDTKIYFETNQAGVRQLSYSFAVMALTEWQLVGFTRSGASARIYRNAVDRTDSAAAHVNPVYNTGNLGIGWTVAATGIDGYYWGARLFSRSLSPAEHRAVFAAEAPLFGVAVS